MSHSLKGLLLYYAEYASMFGDVILFLYTATGQLKPYIQGKQQAWSRDYW